MDGGEGDRWLLLCLLTNQTLGVYHPMSATLIGATLYLPIPAGPKLLLVALSDHANDDGLSCYPGNTLLAKKTTVTVRQVQRNLEALEADEWIRRHKYVNGGKGHAVEWQLHVAKMFAEARENGWTQRVSSVPPFESKGRHPRPERVTSTTGKGDVSVTPTIMNHQEPDSLKFQTENPRQPGESAGAYAARIAPMLADHMSSV